MLFTKINYMYLICQNKYFLALEGIWKGDPDLFSSVKSPLIYSLYVNTQIVITFRIMLKLVSESITSEFLYRFFKYEVDQIKLRHIVLE